jgi:hypothetical protein
MTYTCQKKVNESNMEELTLNFDMQNHNIWNYNTTIRKGTQ